MSKNITVSLAQLSFHVGDIHANAQLLVQQLEQQTGEGILLCPELCLIGYPPDDLLLRQDTPQKIEDALQTIAKNTGDFAIVVGHPAYKNGCIYNAASVFHQGQKVAEYHKQVLANYGVFDEKRHFTKGEQSGVFELFGHQFSLAICEDLWTPAPAQQAKTAGADYILSLNASPYEIGKGTLRAKTLQARVADTGLPVFYANTVGGQDDVLFDGGSLFVDDQIVWQAPHCHTGVHRFTLSSNGKVEPAMPHTAEHSLEQELYDALVLATRDYIHKNGFPGVLLGLSGGIDSALVCAIAADAIGAENVWAVSMPSQYTADMSRSDAQVQAEALGVRFTELPIKGPFEAFLSELSPLFDGAEPNVAEENLQARTRGQYLMALSNKFGQVVLATGNKSEMAVGYCTLYGDMCGGFAPLKDVYKTWVYRLAKYRNTVSAVIPERVITRPPSAELRPDQQDSDSLPDYDDLDRMIELYVEEGASIAQVAAAGFDAEEVRRVAGLIRRSEYKRRQSAPGPKVTPCAFGRERRYPITARFE